MAAATNQLQGAQGRLAKNNTSVSVGFSAEAQAQFASLKETQSSMGAGALVDADMAIESTRLQTLQIQQQLGVQSLSIANQASQTLSALFRG